MNPLVSIIIPCYNTEAFIEDAIKSAINQTYKNIEIIIVDDASTDKSLEIISSIKDSRIRFIHLDTNKGIANARNVGLDNAKGDYICWLDSDDMYHSSFIELLLTYATQYNLDFVECQFSRQIENMAIIPDEAVYISDACDFCKRYSTRQLQTSLWSKLFRKELFDNYRFPVGKIYEENYFYFDCWERFTKCGYIESQLYFYRPREKSIMNSMGKSQLEQDIFVQKYMFHHSEHMPFAVEIRKRIVLNCITLYIRYVASANFDYHGILSIADCLDSCLEDNTLGASVATELTPKKRLIFNQRRSYLLAKSLNIYHLTRNRLKAVLRK